MKNHCNVVRVSYNASFPAGRAMKMIEAIIDPDRLDAVQEELGKAEVFRLTVSDVEGYALSPVERTPKQYPVGIARKLKIEIAVNEEFVEPTVKAIAKGARLDSGPASGGKIFVIPLEDAIRIRTGETGTEAI